MSRLKKFANYVKNLRKFLKYGGVTYVNVSFDEPGKRFEGQKVFVSGGTSGLGLEIASSFLKEGAEVFITGRNKERLDEALRLLESAKVHGMIWDVSDVKSRDAMFDQILSVMSRIDIFINNAGVDNKYINWECYSEDTFDKMYKTNQKGCYFMCQKEGAYLKKNHIEGTIINISSMASLVGNFDPYSITKWGVNCFTIGLAKILAPYNITVNAIAPGTVMTNIEDWYKGRSIEDNAFLAGQRSRRFTMKEEIASLALFLASGSARQITGQIITVDGGTALN